MKKRGRTERREAERSARKDVRARERVAAHERGGSADRPLDVPTAALVEPTARARACPQCGGALRVVDHTAETIDGARLRVAHVVCVACGAPRALYFRLLPSALN